MSRRALAVSLGAAALACSCAGPGAIDTKKLPDAPIAVLYRDERTALDRVDALGDAEKMKRPSNVEGVVRLETLDAVLGGAPDVQRRLQHVQGRLALAEPVSGDVRQLDGVPPGATPLAWSPDRKRLVLRGNWRDSSQIFTWDPASETTEIQTSGPAEHPQGCIDGDGRLVAVEATYAARQLTARLLATPPGGGGLRPLTPGPADIAPTCSPTAPLVAYVTADQDGSLWIAVRPTDDPNAQPRRLGRGADPVFTPDGAWIVYAAKTTQGQRLVRVRPDGSGRAPVGAGPDDESHPAVSPDGRYVAYVVTDLTKRERLRVRRFPDGSGDRPLVTTGDATTPAW